jgi:hypothetical protein
MVGIVEGVYSGTNVNVVPCPGSVGRGDPNIFVKDASAKYFMSVAHVGV